MNHQFTHDLDNRSGAHLFGIRKRTWLVLAASALVLVILAAWAAIAAVSWVVRQAPALGDAGQRAASEVLQQVERVAPGIEQQAQGWLQGAQERVGAWLPEVREQVDAWAPQAREQVDAWIPGPSHGEPRAVGGSDIGPVPPFPGLIRDAYSREAGSERVRYVGPAQLPVVLEHYMRGFEAAGYRREVLSATQDSEHHRYVRGASSFELKLMRAGGGVQVELAGATS